MTTALVRYQPQTLVEMIEVGKILASTGFFADVESEAQAVAKILAGQEAGFGPMASLMGIHMVHGRPELGANLLAASIKRSGKYDYRVLTLTDQEASIQFFERVDGAWVKLGVSTLTMQTVIARQLHMDWDKKESKFKEKTTWKKYPQNMLFAAALRNGVKFHAPDVLTGPFGFADEFSQPADVYDVIEADFAHEPLGEPEPPAVPPPAADVPEEPTAKPEGSAEVGEPRHLTKEETRAVYAYAKEKGLNQAQTWEALEVDAIADFTAFDPIPTARMMINDYARRVDDDEVLQDALVGEVEAQAIGEAEQQALMDAEVDARDNASSYAEGA